MRLSLPSWPRRMRPTRRTTVSTDFIPIEEMVTGSPRPPCPVGRLCWLVHIGATCDSISRSQRSTFLESEPVEQAFDIVELFLGPAGFGGAAAQFLENVARTFAGHFLGDFHT